jgi:cytochrome c556
MLIVTPKKDGKVLIGNYIVNSLAKRKNKMKPATGKYVLVQAITKERAIILAEELFWGESDKLWAESCKLIAEGKKIQEEGDKLQAESNKLWAEGDKFRGEGDKLRAEGNKLHAAGKIIRAAGDKIRAELAIQYRGFIPDWRAMNFIAADRINGVYCFVWSRKEIWFYNGERCPNPSSVKVVWRKGIYCKTK